MHLPAREQKKVLNCTQHRPPAEALLYKREFQKLKRRFFLLTVSKLVSYREGRGSTAFSYTPSQGGGEM